MTRHLSSLLLLAATALDAEDPGRFRYQNESGIAFEVTAKGLSSIRHGDKVLARGGWHAFDAGDWFRKEPAATKVGDGPAEVESLEIVAENHARVTQHRGSLHTVTDYRFEGLDLTISARIENHHPDQPIEVAGFRGLEFTFAKRPEGLIREQHISYFRAHGAGLCHPSSFSPIGGSYAHDGATGVGLSPWRTGWTRTLILWDYTDWNPGKREKLPSRRLLYFVADPVPARGARTVDLRLRVSPDTDWRHLLEPYREHFRTTFGAVRYKADHRWIATDYLNHSQRVVSPENPHGFHGGHRRIDTAEGAELFCDHVIPALRDHDGQGILLWGQGGDDPRGGMYRPDFDILPPEVEAQWPAIAKRFREAGLKLGVTTRPRHLALRRDWQRDLIVDINPDDPGHRAMLWNRFERMIDLGCTMFYLDSFGAKLEDVKLMRFLREQLGEDILVFSEHQCDAILPFSGGYSETTLHAESAKPHYRLWSKARRWEIYAWLVPGSQMASRHYQTKGTPPDDMESTDRWFLRHRVTPLVPVNAYKRAPGIQALQREFLESPDRWK